MIPSPSRALAPLVALALMGATGAAVADTVSLKLADRLPQDHYIPRYSTYPWIEEVTGKTGDAVAIQRYPAQQLGSSRDAFRLLKAGVFEIGGLFPSHLGDQLILSTVAELPGITQTACEAALAYEALATEGGPIHENELKPNGLKLLYVVGLPPYQIFSSESVATFDALAGQKIRSSGGAMDTALTNVGAVPIRMGAAELHESFARGTVDGTSFPAASIFSYDLQDFSKFATQGENFGANVEIYVMTTATWDGLPEAVQTAMTEAGRRVTRESCTRVQGDDTAAIERLREGGTTVVAYPAAEKEKVAAALEPVAQGWAEGLDAKGKAGTEVLEAFRAKVAEIRGAAN